MTPAQVTRVSAIAGLVLGLAPGVDAQSLGTFTWQLEPLCNAVTVQVTRHADTYTLDGFDDQCGAGRRAPVVGLATPNPDGTIGFGLSVVTAPGGAAVHVAATISLASLGGTWQDSSGRTGAFTFGRPGGGTPRPTGGGLGAAAIDTTQVQRRVAGACADGAVSAINQDGSVVCAPSGSGISSVVAGPGLTGGATTGAATLAAVFAGDGAAATAGRSDHQHGVARGVALGALALRTATSGVRNVGVGRGVMEFATSANRTVGIGASAQTYQGVVGGAPDTNVIAGSGAGSQDLGSRNTSIGRFSTSLTGSFNTTLGASAVVLGGAASNATVVGARMAVFGSNEVILGHFSPQVTRVGIGVTVPLDTLHVAGDARVTGCIRTTINVLAGVCSSDARFKTGVTAFGPMLDRVAQLTPVHYRWRSDLFPDRHFGDALTSGLIAQEVEAVLPELVTTDADGYRAVDYGKLPLMAVQAIAELTARGQALRARLSALEVSATEPR